MFPPVTMSNATAKRSFFTFARVDWCNHYSAEAKEAIGSARGVEISLVFSESYVPRRFSVLNKLASILYLAFKDE